MDKALEQEVQALIAGAIKPVTEQMGSLAEAVKPVSGLATQVVDLQKNVGVVADTLKNLPPAGDGEGKKPGEDARAPKTLSAEDVVTLLDERDARRAGSEKREKFLGEKLKDLPPAYRALLGSDESKWAAEEQQIRSQYQADFKVSGQKVPDVSGKQPGDAAAPSKVVDTSKLSPTQLIEAGLGK